MLPHPAARPDFQDDSMRPGPPPTEGGSRLIPVITFLPKDAGMVTDLQSRRFAFDTTRRYTIEEYHRLVEEGILEE